MSDHFLTDNPVGGSVGVVEPVPDFVGLEVVDLTFFGLDAISLSERFET